MDEIETLWKNLLADERMTQFETADGFVLTGEFVPVGIVMFERKTRWQKYARCAIEITHHDLGKGNAMYWSECSLVRFETERYHCFQDWFIDNGRQMLSAARRILQEQLTELLAKGDAATAIIAPYRYWRNIEPVQS